MFFKNKATWQGTDLYKEIDRHTYISFAVFDTLIKRVNSLSPVKFRFAKSIVLAFYEVRLKFQNVVLTGGPITK